MQPDKPANQQPTSDYAAWAREELERHNRMCEEARKAGIILPTGGGTPPALNPDGSLRTDKNP